MSNMIASTPAKAQVIAKLAQLDETDKHAGYYKHGGRYVQGVGALHMLLGWGEHDDGIRRFYDNVLVHEEVR